MTHCANRFTVSINFSLFFQDRLTQMHHVYNRRAPKYGDLDSPSYKRRVRNTLQIIIVTCNATYYVVIHVFLFTVGQSLVMVMVISERVRLIRGSFLSLLDP